MSQANPITAFLNALETQRLSFPCAIAELLKKGESYCTEASDAERNAILAAPRQLGLETLRREYEMEIRESYAKAIPELEKLPDYLRRDWYVRLKDLHDDHRKLLANRIADVTANAHSFPSARTGRR